MGSSHMTSLYTQKYLSLSAHILFTTLNSFALVPAKNSPSER